MNTTTYLNNAEDYYNQMLKKDFDAMGRYLHPDVHFISPLTEMHGKALVVDAAKGLSQVLESIKIRSKFASGNQIMFAYDFTFPAPIGVLRAAVLMEFKDDLISKIELFFDGRQFGGKR